MHEKYIQIEIHKTKYCRNFSSKLRQNVTFSQIREASPVPPPTLKFKNVHLLSELREILYEKLLFECWLNFETFFYFQNRKNK